MKSSRKISIIGFGFTGLSAAWAFLKQGYEVHIYEKESFIGGLLQTKSCEFGLIETAANAILRSSNVDLMAGDFGIEWANIKKTSKIKWVYTDKPKRWPLSFNQSIKFVLPMYKLARGTNSAYPKKYETLKDWGLRVFKGPEFIDQLLGPALQGVYASQPDQLSATLCLDTFFTKHESDPLFLPSVKHQGSIAPKKGMNDFFIKGLSYLEKHNNFSLHLNSKVNLDSNLDSAVIIDTRPDFENVNYINVFSVTLFFNLESRPKFQGFGCLFAKPKDILGVLFNSDIFEDRVNGKVFSETWIVAPSTTTLIADTLEDVLKFRQDKFDIKAEPLYSSVTHWPQGIPKYSVQHESFLHNNFKFETSVNSTKILKVGNYSGHIGLHKILEKNILLSKKY